MSDLELEDQQRQRLAKLERLRERGLDPFPPRSQRTHTAREAREGAEALLEQPLTLTGRIRSRRDLGKASFTHIEDGTGQIQLYLRRDGLGEATYDLFKRDLDLGDFVQASGTLFRTRAGEITLQTTDLKLLAKALSPLPEKWHGLSDVETRYRQRYLDLIANAEVREVFRARARIVSAMRRFLDGRGFLEVETPVLQPLYGGAAARPFVTHHHALGQDLYLRIADELYLKRLIVGGYERVYEIAKDFRNEGIDRQHNPEFTMMEAYQAYADYNNIMVLTEEMVAAIAEEALGTRQIEFGGQQIDLTPPWPRLSLRQAIVEHAGIDYQAFPEQPALLTEIQRRGLPAEPHLTWAKLVDELLKTRVEPNLIQPTFIVDYPVELSPLAKKKPDDPGTVERFQWIVAGLEVGNAFTELNDPLDQRERFLAQARARAEGDTEAHQMDEDFITALMYAMPPTGGLGIGVDRLVMLLTDQPSIRDVILFPQMRTR